MRALLTENSGMVNSPRKRSEHERGRGVNARFQGLLTHVASTRKNKEYGCYNADWFFWKMSPFYS